MGADMSETPNTPAGLMTDRIMMAIRDHIKLEPSRSVTDTAEYNAAWSKVYGLLEQVPVIDESKRDDETCGKLYVPRRAGTFKKCGLPIRHGGRCK